MESDRVAKKKKKRKNKKISREVSQMMGGVNEGKVFLQFYLVVVHRPRVSLESMWFHRPTAPKLVVVMP